MVVLACWFLVSWDGVGRGRSFVLVVGKEKKKKRGEVRGFFF